jgi:hypothetical protein
VSSLIECLVDPNCHGMHDDNYHFQWEKDAMTEPTPAYDSWTVHASSGDHVVENAADVADAFYQFQLTHPDDFVHGVSVVDQDELDRVQRAAEVEASAERARARTRVQVTHAAIRGHCAACDATYAAVYASEHDALCRSRISGESEDRCNCK